MESIVNSQLLGKWYQVAKTYNRREMCFVEVFLYFSIGCDENLESLYVGVKENRNKLLKKFSSKIIKKDDCMYLLFKGLFFRKRLKIEFFNEKDGVMILSDANNDYLTVYSKSCNFNIDNIEKYLSNIDFVKFNNKDVKLYSWDTLKY